MGQNYDLGMCCPACGKSENVYESASDSRDRRAFCCGECEVDFWVRQPWLFFECDVCHRQLFSGSRNIIKVANAQGWKVQLGDNYCCLCKECQK